MNETEVSNVQIGVSKHIVEFEPNVSGFKVTFSPSCPDTTFHLCPFYYFY